MYELIYVKSAEKSLLKLEKQQQLRILAALERTRIRPGKHFERLVGKKFYKLRVGNYRIIADIRQGELIILVIKVGHRKNIYE